MWGWWGRTDGYGGRGSSSNVNMYNRCILIIWIRYLTTIVDVTLVFRRQFAYRFSSTQAKLFPRGMMKTFIHLEKDVCLTNRLNQREVALFYMHVLNKTDYPCTGRLVSIKENKAVVIVPSLSTVEKKRCKRDNANWVHMDTTIKQIVLESPRCSCFEALSISFKTWATGTFKFNLFRSCVHMIPIYVFAFVAGFFPHR